MARLIVLGSSNAVPSAAAENTHMVIEAGERLVLIDSAGSSVLRLERAGLDTQKLTDILITHFHPDHVSGLPLLLMGLWLTGRRQELRVHGLGYTLDRIEAMMELFEWRGWPDFYPVHFQRIPQDEMAPVIDSPYIRLKASPVRHMIPTIGLRMEFPQSGQVAAYSCDTEPCESVVRLAADADILIHEASGDSYGHSSAAQAGRIAARAGAKRLIHFPDAANGPGDLIRDAAEEYRGRIDLARDFMVLDFGARGAPARMKNRPRPEPTSRR